MTKIPEPRFQIGQTVFSPGTLFADERHECPDCLGEKRWKARTPAGSELDMQCLRCEGSGSVKRSVFAPITSKLTIGSIKIDTHVNPGWGHTNVQYMCKETGIGTGTVYNENRLFESEEQADAASRLLADEQTKERQARIEKDSGIARPYGYQFFDLRVEEERQAKYKAEREADDILTKVADALAYSHNEETLRSRIDEVLRAHDGSRRA